ncbi:MAG: phenylalanine--tRNA ligase subunit beta [Armatimonadota bacterium]
MRVPVEWLNEYVETGGSVEELADKLTMAGLEVEEISSMESEEVSHAGGMPDAVDSRVMLTKVTPNRGDWLSLIGVAREVAAFTKSPVKIPQPEASGVPPSSASEIKITIKDPDLCDRYVGVVVRNVTVKDSPAWMKNRLIRAGMRPINNIVDITNYVMLEMGQPLHAFDYSLLEGKEIIVRRANAGEKLTTLDGEERELGSDMLVIADKNRAVGLAGIMGGFDSEVKPDTKNILIESAHFNPVSIRRTSKKLGIVTESSYRFERSVDIGTADMVAKRAAELMRDLADGEIAEGLVDLYPAKDNIFKVTVRPERVNAMLDTSLSAQEMVSFLEVYQIPATLEDEDIVVTVPTFRPDIRLEADVIEEIARAYGYESIGSTLPPAPFQGKDSDMGLFVQEMRRTLMSSGMQEVLTHSLIDHNSIRIAGQENSIFVRNQLSWETAGMRTMIAPNLLRVIVRNQANGIRDMSIYEIGKVYRWLEKDKAVTEWLSVAGAMVGNQWSNSWNLDKEAMAADFYLIKGVVENIFDRLKISGVRFERTEHPMLHPTRAAKITAGNAEIGIIGEVAPEVINELDIKGRPYIFELSVEKLKSLVPEKIVYEHLPKFPALYRHIAAVVKRDVPYGDIRRAVIEAGGAILEDVSLLDVYVGPHVSEDEQSLTLSIVFRSKERTLKDEEINAVLEKIKDNLASEFKAIFRG